MPQNNHGLFTHQQLRDDRLGLDYVEGLLENEIFVKALTFIKKIPPGTYMPMKQAKSKRKRDKAANFLVYIGVIMNKYAKILKLLDKVSRFDAGNLVAGLIIKRSQGLTNVLKWKYLHRDLKQKFKNLRELIATQVDTLGPAAQNAVNQMGYWVKYVDDIQSDRIDENPNDTEYDDATISNASKWWPTVLSVIQPIETMMYGSKNQELDDHFKNTFAQLKNEIGQILNQINQLTPIARAEFQKYFQQA